MPTEPTPVDELVREAPSRDCPLCPRLVAYRQLQRDKHPDWHNAPVPSFGADDARLLIVGLAPGVAGANRTGRPFTGDHAGIVLYPALAARGLSNGRFRADPQDGLRLNDARITNAVRCVPPGNKPLPDEIRTCRHFLAGELTGPGRPAVVLALGRIAHESVLRALGLKLKLHPFVHGAVQRPAGGPVIVATYHTSRYNMNTGRLTEAMFALVMDRVAQELAAAGS